MDETRKTAPSSALEDELEREALESLRALPRDAKIRAAGVVQGFALAHRQAEEKSA